VASRAGRNAPTANAAKTKPALESIIKMGSVSISEITKPKRSRANMQIMAPTTLAFPVALILRLRGQRMQVSGRARYVRPISVPASNPAANAPISEAGPNATNVDSDSRSIPIKG